MPVQDCLFLVGYIASFFGFILFLVGFTRKDWMDHDVGYAGLWADCYLNETEEKEVEECEMSATAEGPAFLELTRTFLILALVCELMGLIGYNFFHPPLGIPTNCKDQLKARCQELSYFLAGIFTTLGVVSYGMNYYDFYSDEKDREDVELGTSFYIASVSAGFGIIFAIVIASSRDTGLKSHFTKKQRAEKLNKLKQHKVDSDARKIWLNNKSIPSPSSQKEKEDVNDEITVKESALKKIITPSNVIIAFTRLKKGIGRKDEQEAANREELEIEYLEQREASKLDDAEHKYKGIFTVEGETQNKSILSPPSSTRIPNTPTPRSVRIVTDPDTTSTSSSSRYATSSDISSISDENLMITAEDGAILPSANATAASVEDTLPPKNVQENVSMGIAPPRQTIRRSVTTLKDNEDSVKWAIDHSGDASPSKLKPKRHLSHGAFEPEQKRSKLKKKPSSSVPEKSIYSLPADNAKPGHLLPPPKYEEVIGYHAQDQAPQPVMTDQSKIYQPYSKSERVIRH